MDIIEEIKKAQISSQHLESKRINSRAPWWTAACGNLRAKKIQLLKKAKKKKHFKEEDWIKYKERSAKLERIIKARRFTEVFCKALKVEFAEKCITFVNYQHFSPGEY
ncbi:hypothetical protein TNCT_272301 [Trichonephila clavata]|uniref:Uncharacterized protein n=1 Tax=Trichonephila clavata TaxID=2740835 RepID=A0A8X6FW65_TRICU|nr:hypothetical protein TNCT_272301 [Trichonephila clavata]